MDIPLPDKESTIEFLKTLVPTVDAENLFYFIILWFLIGIITLELSYTIFSNKEEKYWKNLSYLSKVILSFIIGALSFEIVGLFLVISNLLGFHILQGLELFVVFIFSFIPSFLIVMRSIKVRSGRNTFVYSLISLFFISVIPILLIIVILFIRGGLYKELSLLILFVVMVLLLFNFFVFPLKKIKRKKN